MTTTWRPLKIGGGGFISGIDIAPDGTKVCRADVYGAYLYGGGVWNQLVTVLSMPVADAGVGTGVGAYEIVVAPSNSARFYMLYNGYVFRSDNSGQTWTRTAFTQDTNANPNDSFRGFGPKMAVDPQNSDIVYAGVPSGLFVTENAGASWAAVGGIATPSPAAAGLIVAFDPNSGVSGGKKQGIYASSYGTGVYRSTNGGTSFALTASTPTTHQTISISTDGFVYLTDNGGNNNVRIFNGTSWSTQSIGSGGLNILSAAADPATAARVVAVDSDGNLSISTDHGATWTGKGTHSIDTTDIPWLGFTNGGGGAYSMFGSIIKFDPSVANTLYLGYGFGVAVCNPPSTQTAVVWTDITVGIEELVANWIVSPPSGNPIAAVWDQGVFTITNPDAYPSTKGTTNNSGGLGMGWSVDWASAAPATIVALINWQGPTEYSGVSSNGGGSWAQFASKSYTPNNNLGGNIAASSATNFVLVLTDNGANSNQPYFTTNGGTSWTAITMAGVPTSGTTGWNSAYFFDLQTLCADRVTANTFYIHNNGLGAANTGGVWKSTDSGANWTRVSTSVMGGATALLAKMRTVPGNAGHLFRSSGKASGANFERSTDAGSNWSAVSGVTEVWAFGFGVAGGGGYPAIYIAGFVSGVWGVYRSDDNAATWVALGANPLNSIDQITTVEGDANTYGKVYIGFLGSGFAYGTEGRRSGLRLGLHS